MPHRSNVLDGLLYAGIISRNHVQLFACLQGIRRAGRGKVSELDVTEYRGIDLDRNDGLHLDGSSFQPDQVVTAFSVSKVCLRGFPNDWAFVCCLSVTFSRRPFLRLTADARNIIVTGVRTERLFPIILIEQSDATWNIAVVAALT